MSATVFVPGGKRFDFQQDGVVRSALAITAAGIIATLSIPRDLYKRRVYLWTAYGAVANAVYDTAIKFTRNKEDVGKLPSRIVSGQTGGGNWLNSYSGFYANPQGGSESVPTGFGTINAAKNTWWIKNATNNIVPVLPYELEVEADLATFELLQNINNSGSITQWFFAIASNN